MKKISEILTETRDLLSDESKWTKGRAAKDVNGESVPVYDERAVCWCLIGGLMKVLADNRITNEGWDLAYNGARQAIASAIHHSTGSVAIWNDEDYRKHSEVISALNNAIVDTMMKEASASQKEQKETSQ